MTPTADLEFEFLLLNGYSNMVLASAMEPLRDVKLRSIAGSPDWSTSTLDGNPAYSSSGLKLIPDQMFDPGRKGRCLIIVAGYGVRNLVQTDLSAKLRRAARNAHLVLALDAAPWLVAAAGLLEGRRATIHWQELDAFTEAFPDVICSSDRAVRSGPYLTCGGANSTLEMMLSLIRELFGAAAAFEASTMFIFDPEYPTEHDGSVPRFSIKGSHTLLSALNIMADNIETPLSVRELAERVAVSERTLLRSFSQELEVTPGKYYQIFRLKRARYFAMETELSLEQIALRSGFSSASSLSRAFSSVFGFSIRQPSNRIGRGSIISVGNK